MLDTTITIPEPFAVDEWSNIIRCKICSLDSYASEFFGNSIFVDKHNKSTRMESIVGSLAPSLIMSRHMVCPRCGAKIGCSLGNRIINFMIGESDREHFRLRRVAVSV